jgi:hypothetical protein
MLKAKSSSNWNENDATTIKFITSEGDTLTSMTIPSAENPSIMTCIVECEGETFSTVADFSFDGVNKTMSYTLPETSSSMSVGQKASSS